MEYSKRNKGITILALSVTIIILLILSGICIATLTGDNGLVRQSQNAKEQTEIANEKEVIEQATAKAMGKDRYGNLSQENLQKALDNITKDGNTEVLPDGINFVVKFIETDRYYQVDGDGNVTDPIEVIVDQNPGDIKVGINGETLKGTEESPYEIWCIEDLVSYSKTMSEGLSMCSSYVTLCRDLNFKSKLSYTNCDTTEYDTFLGGDGSTKLIEQLSEKGKGFKPIQGGNLSNSSVIFDGRNHKLENIYVHQQSDAGFISAAGIINIKNLGITGTIISEEGSAGGIVGHNPYNDSKIINCYNKATIVSSDGNSGGIAGNYWGSVENAYNTGKITATNGMEGGIIGNGNGMQLLNVYNEGDVISNSNVAGGIIGYCNYTPKVYNAYNTGNISAKNGAGGIVGNIYDSINIINAYNTGKITSEASVAGGIVGTALWNNPNIQTKYCYYLDNMEKGVGKTLTDTTIKYAESQMTDSAFSEELNSNIQSYQSENTSVDITNWIEWKQENGKLPRLK